MPKGGLQDVMQAARMRVADVLRDHLETPLQPSLGQAMRHAVIGGKCLRGFLVLESARLHGFDGGDRTAAAIECMHAYSLVHDDLPCMDNDDLRRGQPTVHVKWDEATAVLAGDALQALAFELLSDEKVSDKQKLPLVQTLARAAGATGMVGGQAADIAAETANAPLNLAQIAALQQGKTGALITWSAMAGAQLAGEDTLPMKVYGQALGLAFQIADDILDVTGDASTVGKAVGKDVAAQKATFVSLLGLEGARERADQEVAAACEALSPFGDAADGLKELARFVTARTH